MNQDILAVFVANDTSKLRADVARLVTPTSWRLRRVETTSRVVRSNASASFGRLGLSFAAFANRSSAQKTSTSRVSTVRISVQAATHFSHGWSLVRVAGMSQ